MARKIPPKKEEVRVSLLPQEFQLGDAGRAWRRSLLLTLIFVIVLIGALSGYFRFRASRLTAEARERIAQLAKKTTELQGAQARAQEVGNIGQLTGLAKSALQNHAAGERILDILEVTTIPEVTFTQIAADLKGTLVLQGRGKDFASVVRQVLAWHESADISEARISGINTKLNPVGNIEGIEFGATLVLRTEALTWQPN